MPYFSKFYISFSLPSFLFYLGAAAAVAYSFWIYRYTIPEIPALKKYILISLRSLALILILFAIFEPVLNIEKKTIIDPINLVFIDASKSLTFKDAADRQNVARNFVKDYLKSGLEGKSLFFTFGSSVHKKSQTEIQIISSDQKRTNFSQIISSFKPDEMNVASVVVVSDGIITDGANPVISAEKLGIPFYTVAIGDTAHKNDIYISRTLSNDFIYANKPSVISATVYNNGYKNMLTSVSLYENGRLIETQPVRLALNGPATVNFTYTPLSPGEKKLTASAAGLPNEINYSNNKKSFYVNVLSGKIKVVTVSGSPSSDLAFIKNSLSADKELQVRSITELSAGKYLENVNRDKLLDSADVLFLIGFPSAQTSDQLLRKVLQEVKEKSKPFLLTLSDPVDLNRLKIFQSELPFTIGKIATGYTEVQPYVGADEVKNPLLQNSAANIIEAWNSLPPVYKSNSELYAKSESQVLASVKINNVPLKQPLIITKKIGKSRSAAILAKEIWRWKLMVAEKKMDLFEGLALNSVKWLNTNEQQKKFSVKPVKKVYELGEKNEFTAQAYDDASNPIDDGVINIDISSGNLKQTVTMTAVGSGLYEASVDLGQPGDYSYTASFTRGGKTLSYDKGSFSIEDADIEFLDTRTNAEFMSLLAKQTGGKFFLNKNYVKLFDILKQNAEQKSKEKITKSEFPIWSGMYTLIIVILLLSLEWLIRKRSGML
jgi:hypothetical protein